MVLWTQTTTDNHDLGGRVDSYTVDKHMLDDVCVNNDRTSRTLGADGADISGAVDSNTTRQLTVTLQIMVTETTAARTTIDTTYK